MKEYYFLFAISFLAIIFAIIQDMKSKEVANWLNYSLLTSTLAYRAFYSIVNQDFNFFIFGVMGVALFSAVALTMYYGRMFAGGDAKLLIALGAVIPFNSAKHMLINSGVFVASLLFLGAIYSLAFSLLIVSRNKRKFGQEFSVQLRKNRYLFVIAIIFSILLYYIGAGIIISIIFSTGSIFLYIYVKSLDSCMAVKMKPEKLREGDWLDADVRIGRKWIRQSVHGLSIEDIVLLRKAKKIVTIKEGIPFAPAFLLALLFMVFFSESLLREAFFFWAF